MVASIAQPSTPRQQIGLRNRTAGPPSRAAKGYCIQAPRKLVWLRDILLWHHVFKILYNRGTLIAARNAQRLAAIRKQNTAIAKLSFESYALLHEDHALCLGITYGALNGQWEKKRPELTKPRILSCYQAQQLPACCCCCCCCQPEICATKTQRNHPAARHLKRYTGNPNTAGPPASDANR